MGYKLKQEVQIGYEEKTRTVRQWNTLQEVAGCQESLCNLHSWWLSTPQWIKLRPTWSDFILDLPSSRRLDRRPPDAPSNWNYPLIVILFACKEKVKM